MTLDEYRTFANELADEAGVRDGIHGYFELHSQRLWRTLNHFELWRVRDASILEIGPFFSYTPFLFADAGNRVSVFEGDDPVAHPLRPLFKKRKIEAQFGDLHQIFGVDDDSPPRLPYPDDSFDFVICLETMEHFNFNPVPFVRELRRILKPGGCACVTTPNAARGYNRIRMLRGASVNTPIEDYLNFDAGRTFSFHWHEYVLAEQRSLFDRAGFETLDARHLNVYLDHPKVSPFRVAKRLLQSAAVHVIPSLGALCAIKAQKPPTEPPPNAK